MLSENRKLVYAGNRHNDIHYLKCILLFQTFPKDIGPFVLFLFLFLFGLFFESAHYEKQEKNIKKKKKKKKNIKRTTIYMIYKQVEQTDYCVEAFQIIMWKEHTVYVLSNNQ